MDRESWLVDRFGNPIRPEHPVYQPFTPREKVIGIGGLALSFIGAGEGPLLAIFPMVNHPIIVIVLAIQSALFLFIGIGLAGYVGVSHFTGISWSVPQLLRQPILWLFATMLISLGILFGWQNIHIHDLQRQITRLTNSDALWTALNQEEIQVVKDGVEKLPAKNIVITRPDTNDARTIADNFAEAVEDHWNLLALPYTSLGDNTWGVVVLASNIKDPAAIMFRRLVETVLHKTVGLQELPRNTRAGNQNVDIQLAFGSLLGPKFLTGGTEHVAGGATSVRVALAPKATIVPYHVDVTTSWGATAQSSDIQADHFTLQFSTAAPTAGDPQANWLAYHY